MPWPIWFQSACVKAGLDIVDFAGRLKQTIPAAALSMCRRYEATFAAGEVNATMIGNYAIALSRAGETEALSALCAAGSFVLPPPHRVHSGI